MVMASMLSLSLTSLSLPNSQSLVRSFFILLPIPTLFTISITALTNGCVSLRTPRKSPILLPPVRSIIVSVIKTLYYAPLLSLYYLFTRQKQQQLFCTIVPTKKDASLFRCHCCRNLLQHFTSPNRFGR